MEKKEYYIKESLKLFMKYGVKTVTIGQITSHLNVSSKTLYAIFGDKTGLVDECFLLYKKNSEKAFEDLQKASDNVADMLVKYYNMLVDSITRINPNFYNDIARYFPEIWDSDEAFGIIQTKALLVQGVEEGLFFSAIDIGLCSETLTILLRSLFELEPYSRDEIGSHKLMTNVIWPYFRGICTPEGVEEFRKYRKYVALVP